MLGAYAASKFAWEGLADALRVELRRVETLSFGCSVAETLGPQRAASAHSTNAGKKPKRRDSNS